MGKTFRNVAGIAALAAATLAGVACKAKPRGAELQAAPTARPAYEVYAIRYATVTGYPLSGMIAGAERGKKIDLAMTIWLLKGADGRDVLVDAGFHRDDLVKQWHPSDFVPPDVALARTGVKAEDVTDLIISHIHWDHLDGIDLFPRARIWIQKDEFEYYTDSAGTAKNRTIDAGDAKLLAAAAREGRVTLIDGDDKEIIPGITVYTGGKHTFASQFAAVHTTEGTVVVASDNAYLYANLEQHRPIAQTLDSLSNLRAQARMIALASSPRLIVPGHDPEVFVRFPLPGNGVARIR